ncbi:MAG: S8 family peptidase [Cytophagales bacterium]|nr:S8 family peptidase [Cytophagales bacterium]
MALAACLLCLSFSVLSQGRVAPHMDGTTFRLDPVRTPLSVTVKDIRQFLEAYAGKVKVHYRHEETNALVISISSRDVFAELKKDPRVLFLDSRRKPMVEASLDYASSSFNRINKVRRYFPNRNGAGQKISVKEQHFDATNIDLRNRSFSTAVSPVAGSQHATNMTVLAAGAGNSSFRAQGVAPQAQFTSSDFNNLFPDAATIFNGYGIHVQNHSYGVAIENYYGNEAVAYDQHVEQNPTVVHVFSSGNLGDVKPASGLYQQMSFANLSANFKQAKNVLVVSAVDTMLLTTPRNSRGPAYDGRLKPELTAYGQGGTSEAAAMVSGIVSLIQEHYYGVLGTRPEASMVKAILVATADDLGPSGIDYQYGYGSVNAYNALQVVELNQLFYTTLSSGAQMSVPLNLPDSVAELRIAVAWTDPAASPNANPALVHDIDSWLTVGPSTIRPWVLSNYPRVDSLTAAPKRKPDHLNNVEYITVSNPVQGSYPLTIKANALTADQNVSVAYWLKKQTVFGWDFPLSTDIAKGGEKNLLLWEAAPNQTGMLSVQINGGSWSLVEASVALNGSYYWHCPDTFARARLRMVVATKAYVTDEFLISPMLKLRTAFHCADSMGLYWNSRSEATGYDIFTMGSQYLTKIATTQDTLFLSTPTPSAEPHFAVAPLLNGVPGLRSDAINFTQQGASCYLNLFSALRFSPAEVKVHLSLSSWHRVDHVTIHKTHRQDKRIFKTLAPGNLIDLDFSDAELLPGTMTYQAEIVFQNGNRLMSPPAVVTIEEKGKAILFPNPVSQNDDLHILSEGGGQLFRILEPLGKTVFEKELHLVLDAIDIGELPVGMYYYQLVSQGKVTDTGRFIKY